jgi:hypothetical protein
MTTRKDEDSTSAAAADDDDDDEQTTATPKTPLTATAKQEAKAMQALAGGAVDRATDESKVDKAKIHKALQELAKKNAEDRQRRLAE